MDDPDKIMKLSTFKMPEAKYNKKLNTIFSKEEKNIKKDITPKHKSQINVECNDIIKIPQSHASESISKSEINAETFNSDNSTTLTDIAEQISSSALAEETKSQAQKKNFSPAERLKTLEAILPYRDPAWAGVCEQPYSLEEVKNGIVVGKIELKDQQRVVFGRLPSSDHVMEHPSISRHHAILQHRKIPDDKDGIGWYLFDLDSVHGTWLNKKRVAPSIHVRLRVGYLIKFGGSTRIFILQGPLEDQEAESELSVTELKEKRDKQLRELDLVQMIEDADAIKKQGIPRSSEEGCSWGMLEDAADSDNESEDIINPFSSSDKDPLQLDDPKKTLRGYFDREGLEMPEYVFEELGFGKRICRIELPIDSELGCGVFAEVNGTGKKKDMVVQTALEACRMLDRHGLLRNASRESASEKRKRNWKEEDYYDSDEDTYLDRTGTIESKRRMRMTKVDPKLATNTFDSLTLEIAGLDLEISGIESKLAADRLETEKLTEDQGLDTLDAFMVRIKNGGMDTRTKSTLKKKLVELRQKRLQLGRLLKLATPAVQPLAIKKSTLESETFSNLLGSANVNSTQCENLNPVDESLSTEFKAEADVYTKPIRASVNTGKIKHLPKNKKIQEAIQIDYFKNEDDFVEEDDEDVDDELVTMDTNHCLETDTDKTNLVTDRSSINANDKVETVSSLVNDDFKLNTGKKNSNIVNTNKNIDKKFSHPENNVNMNTSTDKIRSKGDITMDTNTNKATMNNDKTKRKQVDKVNKSKTIRDDLKEVDWLPPTNQLGDGKNNLNEKYGY